MLPPAPNSNPVPPTFAPLDQALAAPPPAPPFAPFDLLWLAMALPPFAAETNDPNELIELEIVMVIFVPFVRETTDVTYLPLPAPPIAPLKPLPIPLNRTAPSPPGPKASTK